jgi:hypothetical protein
MCETALALASGGLHNERVLTCSRRSLLIALTLGALAACSSAARDDGSALNGGQTGSESYGCLPESALDVAADELTPIGLSASQALAAFAAREPSELRYTSGELIGYRLMVEQSSSARFEERVWKSDDSGMELAAPDCSDALVVPVSVTLDTDDGAFAERWQSELTIGASGIARLALRTELDELAGSYRPSGAETRNASDVKVLFDFALLGSSLSGSIAAQIEESVGGSASARSLPIATLVASTP